VTGPDVVAGKKRRCWYCGTRFEGKPGARYCTTKCRVIVHRAGGTSAALRAESERIVREALAHAARLQRAAYLLDGGRLWDGTIGQDETNKER
jgi:hypothetical protein